MFEVVAKKMRPSLLVLDLTLFADMEFYTFSHCAIVKCKYIEENQELWYTYNNKIILIMGVVFGYNYNYNLLPSL